MLAFILSGSVRIKIFVYLCKKVSYASEIARNESLSVTSVARSMKEMERVGVVECVNPNSKRQKFYRLTRDALKLKEYVIKKY